VRDKAPSDPALACPICSKLIYDAVRTPCCQTAYCEECIQTALLERDFECPNCESKVASLDKVVEDAELRQRVKAYVEEEI
jgi:protein MPE1